MGKIEDITDSMGAYDYLVNHIGACDDQLPELMLKIKDLDLSGQFLASAARFMSAVDREKYEDYISELVEDLIIKDRERKYIGVLMPVLWGEDYEEKKEELSASDANFRIIYKRLHPAGI